MGIRPLDRPERQRPIDRLDDHVTDVRRSGRPTDRTTIDDAPAWQRRAAWAERADTKRSFDAPGPEPRGGRQVGAPTAKSPNAARPLPDIRYDSTDAGDFYCEHCYFVAQQEALRPGSSVLTDQRGDRMVGFLHLPEDDQTTEAPGTATPEEVASRHADTRRVVGAAIAGYVDEASTRTDGPIRVMISGYGPFGTATNNPSGDFVSHRANLDAAMEAAFGANLVGRPPADADLSRPLSYQVRLADGSTREVQLRAALLPVSDDALDPSSASSVPGLMRSFQPHAVLSMGVRPGSDHYDVEGRADDGGLDTSGGGYQHERGRARSSEGRTNGALRRAIEWARRHPAP